MRHGLEIAAAGEDGDPRSIAELARVAEMAGWDGIFLEDYIIHWQPGAPTYDPWVTLAAIALATDRIRIGTTVTPLPRRRPWKVARETMTLDHLSHGRLTLGIGLGNGSDPDFAGLGEVTAVTARADMLDEALDVLTGLWSGRPFRYRGRHYTVEELTFLPPPVQSPRIPIWIGGSAFRPGPVRRAARWDGMVPVPNDGRHLTPTEVETLRATIERHRRVPEPFDIALGGLQRGDDWDREREHIAAVGVKGATWWLEWIPSARHDVMRAAIERGPLWLD